jgi:TP901 family phage tail tape measure protein
LADKDYSVDIKVGVDLDTRLAKQELADFEKELKGLLSGGGDLKIAIGGYSVPDLKSQKFEEKTKKALRQKLASSGDWDKEFENLEDAVNSGFEGILEAIESGEADAMRALNDFAKRWAKMLGITFIENIAEAMGEQEFALPKPDMTDKERKRATQDFITSGDTIVYSPAALTSAIETLAAKFPNAQFPQERIPKRDDSGDGGISFRKASSFGWDSKGQGAFDSVIPEITEETKDALLDLIDRALQIPDAASGVEQLLRSKLEDLVIEIAKKGYFARERTFGKDEEGTTSSDTADSYMRANEALRKTIALGEMSYGLEAGTVAKTLPGIFDKFISSFDEEARTSREAIVPVFDKFTQDLIRIESGRLPSDPAGIKGNLLGVYPNVSGDESVPIPSQVNSIFEQFFNNPAIVAGGKDGIEELFTQINDIIEPKVFLSGSRSISEIPKEVQDQLNALMERNVKFLIGDAPGVDASLQKLLADANYKNVEIYYTGEAPRNNVGNFDSVRVEGGQVAKDKAMTNAATELLAVFDTVSKGTLANINRGIAQAKTVNAFNADGTRYVRPEPVKPVQTPKFESAYKSSFAAMADASKQIGMIKAEISALTYSLDKARGNWGIAQKILNNPEGNTLYAGEKNIAWAEKQQDPEEIRTKIAAFELQLKEAKARLGNVFSDMGKVAKDSLITPEAIVKQAASAPEFNSSAYRSGIETIKNEVEASGEKLILAFDTEFNDKLPQIFTEASIGLKDSTGKFREVFGFLQAPPSSEYKNMAQGAYGANKDLPKDEKIVADSVKELEKRAALLNQNAKAFNLKSLISEGDLGAKDFETNFKQFYDKMSKLTAVLQIASDLEIPVAGSNLQTAEFSRLFKSLKFINETIDKFGLGLTKLEEPVELLLLDTMKVADKAAKAGSRTGLALTSESMPGLKGAGVENLLRNLATKFPEVLGKNIDRIELKPGGGFKIDGLDAHYARADNQAVLIVAEAMAKFEDLVPFMKADAAKDYLPKKKEDKQLAQAEAAAGGGSGGLDARRAASEAEDSARRRFLTEKQLAALIKDLTENEKKQVIIGLDKLQNTREHQKLVQTEKSLKESILGLEKRLKEATTTEDKRDALKALMAEKAALENLIVAGQKLETQKRDQIKLEIRGKDVADKNLQTTAKQIDEMNRLRSTTGGVGKEIVGQLKEQAAAAKSVEQQTKSLINTWVTGRYALYDVGNAYAGVSRQLWQASRQIFNITQAYRSYETAFTSVERAIQPAVVSMEGATEEAQSLKNAFIELSEQIPVSFEEISRIATLGAQMGVSASGIVDFTEVVAKFSSVTGVAADTVAQKFGRIAELANVDYSEFTNLGSSILFAGMNAVATEPEIMTLSESIAAVSSQAGLVPSEIVGMATALASTGIQAEQARGVFTRVFADIDRAVSVGGKSLDAFAGVAGMSSEDFKAAWGKEGASYEVLRAILGGLGATEDLTKAFDSLNIVETREVNTLTRLAENLNVVDQAISDATQSFEDGVFLGDTFGKTVDNLDSQITIFNNNLKSLTEQISKGLVGAVELVIGPVNYMLELFKEMTKNPLFSYLAGGSLAVTAFGAAATLGISAFAKLTAQIYAFRVAAINTANNRDVISGPISMIKQLTGWGSGLIEMRDQLKGASKDVRGVITPMNMGTFSAFGDSIERVGIKMGFLSNTAGRAERTQKKLLETSNIYLAKSAEEADAITAIISTRKEQIAQIEMETAHKSTHLARTKEEIDAINLHNSALDKERASRIAALGGAQIYIATVNGETRALTANEMARLRGIANSGKVSAAKRAEAAATIASAKAIDMETRSAAMASTMKLGFGGLMGKLAGFAGVALSLVTTVSTVVGVVNAAIEKTKINLLESGGGVASLRDAIKQDTLEYNKLTAAQKASSNEYTTLTVKARENTSAIDPNAKAIGTAAGASQDWLEKNKAVVESISSQTIALGKNTKEWALNAMMQDENLQAALKLDPDLLTNLEKYGTSFQEILDGIFADPDSDPTTALQAQLDLIIAQKSAITQANNASQTGLRDLDAEQAVADLQAQEKELNTTINTVRSLGEALRAAIAEGDIWGMIRGMLGLKDAVDELGNESQNTEDDVNGMGEALRTVLDYASDLSGILSRIIELEFGKQMSRDDITTGWRDMANSIEDANKAIKDANTELDDLTADKSILEYQLSVAERYGDEARAAKIRAELTKVTDQITESEKQLAEAKSNASTELEGDTDAAIRNRAALIGMLGTYQARVEMLAKLGMNQAELTQSSQDLKRQFLTEAKALGFSEAQLADYANTFDNFASAAKDAPRDVDIEVLPGLTAAEQAIEEWLAKDRSTTVDVKVDTEDADTDIADWSGTYRELTDVQIKKINTLAADGTLKSWLTLEREFGAPKVTGITADAADKKITEWLNLVRILAAPRIVSVDTLAADGSLKSWLTLQRYFGAPKVTDITADAADKKIQDFLNKERNIVLGVTIKSSDMAQAQATAALGVARQFPTNSKEYTSYIEQYRALLKVANDLRGRGMATGGLVNGPGSGTSDSIPTMLSNGEYVMKAKAVNAYGVEFFNALNQQRVGFAPASAMGGSMSQQGPSMVFLSPEDRQLLRQFGDRPVNLYADSTKIAEVANNGNTKMSRRGSR